MSETWHYDIITGLTEYIFAAEKKRLLRREVELVEENKKLSGPMDGFFYKGVLYSDLDHSIRARGKKGNLHPSLYEAVEAHYKDERETAFDKDRVRQALALLLKECRSLQDIRDALPNSLQDVIPGVREKQRTRPEAYTVVNNPRHYKQYLKLREKIEFYNAAKLLY